MVHQHLFYIQILLINSFILYTCIRRFLLTLAIGQVLGLLLSGSGVFSQLLKENYFINTPSTQVFFMYFLLAITFTPYLAAFQDNFDKILRDHWWKYGLLAILDVEGNYCFVLAYQYTSLTSIQVCACMCMLCIAILYVCVSISILAMGPSSDIYLDNQYLKELVCVCYVTAYRIILYRS